MPSTSRAGLISLIFLFLSIYLAAAAPLAERLSSLVERYDNDNRDIAARSLRSREFDVADPEYITREYLSIFYEREPDMGYDEFANMRREYDFSVLEDRDLDETRDESDQVLYRRRKSIAKKIRESFHKLGQKVKAGFQKAGKVIKKGLQTAGKFIKKTVGKVAKVWLKYVAAVASVAAKAIKFIPGIGEPLSVAIKGTAIGANIASDKIHANIGKFSKFTNGLNYVISPGGSAAKAAAKGLAKKGGGAGKAGSLIADLLV